MDEFDRKVIAAFPGKSVRKDLTALMKKGANVPTYVLEYLLGMYCATDDEETIKVGLEKIKRILSENYVRPDQSDYVKSKIKENGQYTVIDKVTVRLDEKEDKYIFYYQDKAVDITKMFDKEKECYLVINNGEKDIYFVISYKDKIDEDSTISQYSDENAAVTQGVTVKDIKDRFIRIK